MSENTDKLIRDWSLIPIAHSPSHKMYLKKSAVDWQKLSLGK